MSNVLLTFAGATEVVMSDGNLHFAFRPAASTIENDEISGYLVCPIFLGRGIAL